MLLLVIDQGVIATLVVVERIGIHPSTCNTGSINIAEICADRWRMGLHSGNPWCVFRGPRRRSRRPRLRRPPEHSPKVVAAHTFCRAVSTCQPAVDAAETRANLFYASNTLALKGATRRASYYLPPMQRPWVVGTPWLEQWARLVCCCCEEAECFPSGRSPRDYASRARLSQGSTGPPTPRLTIASAVAGIRQGRLVVKVAAGDESLHPHRQLVPAMADSHGAYPAEFATAWTRSAVDAA